MNQNATAFSMNEPANMYNGGIYGCAQSKFDNPPYVPGNRPLYTKTVCMSAKHYLGRHYDVHNMYAIYEAKATRVIEPDIEIEVDSINYLNRQDALIAIRNRRPFSVSRATVTGHGQYATHWTGDIWSSWEQMRWTIPSLIEFNMFGN